jgi:hypothetical protein
MISDEIRRKGTDFTLAKPVQIISTRHYICIDTSVLKKWSLTQRLLSSSYPESTLHILGRMSPEKCPISTAAHSSKSMTIESAFVEEPREDLLCISETLACLDTLDLCISCFDELELPRRECEIAHRKCDLLFAWITVLCDEIAGIASEAIVIDPLYSSFSTLDWFVDASKVICWLLFGISTGKYSFFYGELKIAPSTVSEESLELARIPELYPIVIMSV